MWSNLLIITTIHRHNNNTYISCLNPWLPLMFILCFCFIPIYYAFWYSDKLNCSVLTFWFSIFFVCKRKIVILAFRVPLWASGNGRSLVTDSQLLYIYWVNKINLLLSYYYPACNSVITDRSFVFIVILDPCCLFVWILPV